MVAVREEAVHSQLALEQGGMPTPASWSLTYAARLYGRLETGTGDPQLRHMTTNNCLQA